MRGPMSIRLAKSSDLLAMASVHTASVRRLCARDYPRSQIEQWLAPGVGLHARLLRTSTVFVAERSGRVVAFAAVRLATREVRAVYVAPAATGTGIGGRLMLRMERLARALGIRELRLAASVNAAEFYTRLGWHRDPRGAARSRQPGCVTMRKRLRP